MCAAPRREKQQEGGENGIMNSLIIYILLKYLIVNITKKKGLFKKRLFPVNSLKCRSIPGGAFTMMQSRSFTKNGDNFTCHASSGKQTKFLLLQVHHVPDTVVLIALWA
jgi:hypothetical protein